MMHAVRERQIVCCSIDVDRALRPEKVSAAKTKHAVAKCLASVAAPYKSKAGPLMSEKPVGRHRAQGKTKRYIPFQEWTLHNLLS